MLFQDKVAIVTGASQGIGKKIALTLAEEGSHVCVFDVVQDGAKDVVNEILRAGGRASAHCIDVSNTEQVMTAVDAVVKSYSTVHFLVNNAGIIRDNLLMRMKAEEWDSVINVNLKGVFNCSKAVIRTMMGSRFGRIVNISSVVGEMGNVSQTNYSASKAGVIGFTKSLAREVASRGITVNAIAPGYIETTMTDNLSDAVKEIFLNMIPLKKLGKPEDVANAVRFLLSDDASYITGQVLNINGGMYM